MQNSKIWDIMEKCVEDGLPDDSIITILYAELFKRKEASRSDKGQKLVRD